MKAFGLARLGRNVEIRYMQNGDAVANLALAFSYGRKGTDGKRPTQWVEASLWGKRAEALAPCLAKGGLVSVSLEEVHIETYQGRNGEGHKLAARVVDIELAGDGERQGGQGQHQAAAPAPAARAPQRPAAPASSPSSGFDDMDSDIPF